MKKRKQWLEFARLVGTGITAVALVTSCSDPDADADIVETGEISQAHVCADGTCDGEQPPVLEDTNPDPDIVEVDLEAVVTEVEYIPGIKTVAWGYNGMVPGPTIEVEVGQTLVVNFTNSLPEPTTIHWHGVELPANMDGSNISQTEVPSGGSFRYEFKALTAATYWYHPHLNSNEQVERGLHGTLIIRGPSDDRVRIPRDREYVLMTDDILLDEDGQVAEFATDLSAPIDPVDRAEELFNARQGNLLIVNGHDVPTIDVRPFEPIRLRIIAPSNGRFMRLSAPGQLMFQIGTDGGLLDRIRFIPPVRMVEDEETGELVSSPDPSQGLLLTPSERADVVIIPLGRTGEHKLIEWHDFPMGRHATFSNDDGTIGFGDAEDDGKRSPEPLVRLHFQRGFGFGWYPRLPLRQEPLQAHELAGAERLPVFFGHAPPQPNGAVTFFTAVKLSDELQAALDTKLAEASDPDITGPIPGMVGPPPFMPQPFPVLSPEDALHAEVGETRIWEVTNFTGGDHTFHAHGFFFQPLELIEVNLDGETAEERVKRTDLELVQKDSIRLPKRSGGPGRSWSILRLSAQLDDTDKPVGLRRTPQELVAFGKVPTTMDPLDPSEGMSGGWVAHCHFLEHVDRGMMTFLNLVLP